MLTIKLIISFQFSLPLWFNFRNQSNHVKNFFSPTRIYYSAMLKARISCFQNHDSQVFYLYDLYKKKRWEENTHSYTTTTTKVMLMMILWNETLIHLHDDETKLMFILLLIHSICQKLIEKFVYSFEPLLHSKP